MTQGDQQQHPSGTTTAACSSCPQDAVDSAESRGSSPPVETVTSSAGMEGRPPHHPHHHHPHYHKEQTTSAAAADGDVKTLLHFVNLASSDIKAALDKSAPIRKSSENRKYLQKQLKRSPPPFFTEDDVYKSNSATVSPPVVPHENHGFSPRRFISNLNSSPTNHPNSSLHFSERLMASASLHRDHIKNSDLNLIKELTFGNIHRGVDHQLLGKRTSNRYLDKQHVPSGREFTDMTTLSHEEGGKDRENPVPLRKRRLPASFWQEPGKSENHKTTPGAMAGLSPIAVNASLKFPLISSLTQGFTDSRPTSLDKNAIYPSSDHQCFPGQSFMPSLSNSLNSENYLNRTLNFPYSSICSCHQHAELYGYDHGPACATYASRHGGEAPGMFTPIGPTRLLASSRWHVPSLAVDRPDLCHPSPAPRVVKPIPTKSISSYPHRYHPIYT